MKLLLVALATAVVALAAGAASALADGPGVGTPAIVAVGDSAISGEAGRWAGNTNLEPWRVDALGPTAYYDNSSNSAETTPGCHRSKAAEIWIGGGVLSANLACSGARTSTQPYASGSNFKPGLDFYDDGAGHIGQARRRLGEQHRSARAQRDDHERRRAVGPHQRPDLRRPRRARRPPAVREHGWPPRVEATGLDSLGEPNTSYG
jgi:hypothetical protein